MALDRDSFTLLCNAAAVALRADDPEAAARGDQFVAHGIWCQIHHRKERNCLVLICDLGDPEPRTELELYREMLTIQSTFAGNMEAMFIRDPINETLLFTACVPLTPGLDGEGLAASIEPILKQVTTWRETLLKGQFVDYERLAERLLADLAGSSVAMLEV